jgi:Protein kinase domain
VPPSTAPSPESALARAPRVIAGTRAETDTEAFALAFANTGVDARLWTGAFATNVWAGRYEVDGVLGQGGQGTTFTGTDKKTGVRVALKMFDLSAAKDWKAHELFDREVQTLKHVSHPLMPQFLDVIADEDTGARVLVMTQVPGESLEAIVKRDGPMKEAALWTTMVDIADVLGALHGQSSPIVHRDIKPHNLIRRPDGKVALVDFGGVGRVRKEAGSTVVGTFGYMAPEQLYGSQTPATDLYALGATLLFCATGTQPEELPREGLRIDVDAAAPQLSARMRALLKKLLSPEPAERPADASALLEALRRISTEVHEGPRNDVEPLEGEIEQAVGRLARSKGQDADIWVGVVSLVFGVLGVAGAVIVGQVLLPLVLTIIAAFSGPEQRQRLHLVRDRVRDAARTAQQSFEKSAEHGAHKLENVAERDKLRRDQERSTRKEQRRMEKNNRKQARRVERRQGKFWV